MANKDTVWAITTNLQTVLQGLGIKFSKNTYEDMGSIPAGLIPHGDIQYITEVFEYGHGQKPLYSDMEFSIQVVLSDRSSEGLMRTVQDWVHRVRDGVTVDALNIGDLASSKLVSRASTGEIRTIKNGAFSVIEYTMQIRYREL